MICFENISFWLWIWIYWWWWKIENKRFPFNITMKSISFYFYIYKLWTNLSFSLSLYIYIYIYIYIYVCVYIDEKERVMFVMKSNGMRKKKTVFRSRLSCFTSVLALSEYNKFHFARKRSIIIYTEIKIKCLCPQYKLLHFSPLQKDLFLIISLHALWWCKTYQTDFPNHFLLAYIYITHNIFKEREI